MKFVNRKSDLLVLNKYYVEQQLKELRLLLKESDKRVAIGKRLPNIRVKVSKSNGCNQYYYINPDTKKLVYVKKEDLTKVARIIQRDYNIEVNKAIRKQIDKLEKFIANYNFDAIDKVYEKMNFNDNILKANQNLNEQNQKIAVKKLLKRHMII